MAEPLFKIAKHKPTGEWVRVRSDDGGKTWAMHGRISADPSAEEDPGEPAEPYTPIPGEEPEPLSDEPDLPEDESDPMYHRPAVAADAPQVAQPTVATPAQPQTESAWDYLAKAGDALKRYQDAADPIRGADKQEAESWLTSFSDDATDFFRGMGQGFTFSFGDEAASRVTPEVDDGTNIPRFYRAGSAQADLQQTMRGDNAQSQERSPWLYGAGEVAGTVPAAIATAPLAGLAGPSTAFGRQVPQLIRTAAPAAAGTGVLARTAPIATRSAVQGGAMGAVSGAGRSEGDTVGEVAEDAAIGGTVGAGAGAAGAYVGAGLEKGAQKLAEATRNTVLNPADAWEALLNSRVGRGIADWADDLSPRVRASAPGAYGSELKKLAKEQGIEFTDRELGEGIERVFPPQPGAFGIPKPRSARDYYDAARVAKEDLRSLNNTALRELDDQGVTAPVRQIDAGGEGDDAEVALMAAIDEAKKRARDMGNLDAKPLLRKIQQIEQEVIAPRVRGQSRIPASLAYKLKVDLDAAGYPKGAIASTSDSIRAQAHRAAADGPRAAFYDAVRKQAEPATEAAVQQVQRDYPIVAMTEEMSLGRAAQETGNQQLSLPSVIAATVEGPAAIPRIGMWEATKTYGKDATANALRGVQRAFTPAQRTAAAPVFGPQPALRTADDLVEQAARDTSRVPSAWEAFARHGGQAAFADDGETTGGDKQRLIRWAVQTRPDALGPYARELSEAVQSGDDTALAVVINKYASDPRFDRLMATLQSAQGGTR